MKKIIISLLFVSLIIGIGYTDILSEVVYAMPPGQSTNQSSPPTQNRRLPEQFGKITQLRGANYIPSYAKNPVDAWLYFDEEHIRRELDLAKLLNLNLLRVFLSYAVYEENLEKFLDDVRTLVMLANERGIIPILVLFDGCFGTSAHTENPLIWSAHPGPHNIDEEFLKEKGFEYVDRVIREVLSINPDIRVIFEVMNEPESSYLYFKPPYTILDKQIKKSVWAFVFQLLTFIHNKYPDVLLTVGAPTPAFIELIKNARLPINFYSAHIIYQSDPQEFENQLIDALEDAQRADLPLLVSEIGPPTDDLTYKKMVEILDKYNVSFCFWELMIGTDNWNKTCGVFFHSKDNKGITVRSMDEFLGISGYDTPPENVKEDKNKIPDGGYNNVEDDVRELLTIMTQTYTNKPNSYSRYTFLTALASETFLLAFGGENKAALEQGLKEVDILFGKGRQGPMYAYEKLDQLLFFALNILTTNTILPTDKSSSCGDQQF